ncbi:MAG: DUF805 domain-containing protein [Sphingomonas sp.]|nr:DUF805 domain-containing protein [Sphingomonas sp.]
MNDNLSPIDWAKRPLLKYADFSGRAPRSEYWWFFLVLCIVAIVVSIVEDLVGLGGMVMGIYGPISLLLLVGTIAPLLAVAVRRLHDTNRKGWWILLPLIPEGIAAYFLSGAMLEAKLGGEISDKTMASVGTGGLFGLLAIIGAIVVIVFLVLPGNRGDNQYGPDPFGAVAKA